MKTLYEKCLASSEENDYCIIKYKVINSVLVY